MVLTVFADEEVSEHGLHLDPHYEDGEHNVEYDHQAVLGSRDMSKEFSELSPEEAKTRLDAIITKMDTNADGLVTREELSVWIIKSFTKLDEEDARDKLKEQDYNTDGKISWEEYLKAVYGFTPQQVVDMNNDDDPEIKKYADLVKDDAMRFDMADESKDGILDQQEYYAFQHPWNYEHMHRYEVISAFKDHDKNRDSFIDLKEYLGDDDRDWETEIVDTENFHAYDEDGDGKLNEAEVLAWVIPDYKGAADDETDHLIEHSDVDSNGKLSREEILGKYELWVGSSAKDYGRVLHEEL